MQVVLDSPMTTQHGPILACAHFLAANEIACLFTGDAVDGPLAITHADGSHTCPSGGVAKSTRQMEYRIAAVLLPTMAALPCLIGVVLHLGEAVVAGVDQRLPDIVQQMFL